ncbi:hypothetical protein [Streptomyces globisporus]|uniref:hypothetical protein n=1 Tax=Streptomyces globisporus TaxID=1908 RepID=UPI0037017BF2
MRLGIITGLQGTLAGLGHSKLVMRTGATGTAAAVLLSLPSRQRHRIVRHRPGRSAQQLLRFRRCLLHATSGCVHLEKIIGRTVEPTTILKHDILANPVALQPARRHSAAKHSPLARNHEE